MKIRGLDCWGSGEFGAPRGDRLHQGIDLCCKAEQEVRSLTYGTVNKIGWCYNWDDHPGRKHMKYVEVYLDGNRFRYLYVNPSVQVGESVAPGTPIGYSIDLEPIFPGITQHYHLEAINPAGDRINPASMLPEIES